jgi:tetratricopeptide (TPR) repeat protein
LGIPNTCNRCHEEESVDWAIEWSEKWYGEKLTDHRQRARARAIHGAYAFEPQALEALFELLESEDVAAWTATYTGLLANYLPEARAAARLRQLLKHDSPLVRERAVSALGSLPHEKIRLLEGLGDPLRTVRISAARTLQTNNHPIPEGDAKAQWQAYLDFNADRPQSLMIQAYEAARKKDIAASKKFLARAVNMDQANGTVYHQAAIILSTAGDSLSAEKYLKSGWKKDPDNPQFPYSLGLLAAESGDLQLTIGYLEETVANAPDFYRAWYNLSLAYGQLNRPEDAARAMEKARGSAGNN